MKGDQISALMSLATILALLLSELPYVNCDDYNDYDNSSHDPFRMSITTDLEAGIDVSCVSEDGLYTLRKRHVNPQLMDYTFIFDDLTQAHNTKFFCTVLDEHNHDMIFSSWEPRFMNAEWRFPWLNDQREVRWVVNNGGAWLYMKGRKTPDSIMRWILMTIWPHLQDTIKGRLP